ncbi:MAG: hypothetical protein F2806_05665 [Actinobacteria bacterium]|uniref:Unannotated protein n=1 Tax=freshwater metagenome TaxID=449393 RepID=A0A6J7G957_9ZZZZ|nr:hypothetical protein [Actinomycetota bacterium]
MAAKEIDVYLESVPEPQRSTLQEVRRRILSLLPVCEQCISYGMPAFKVEGTVIAGFAAAKTFNSYYPHSGSILDRLKTDLMGYECTRGALHFPMDQPLSKKLLKQLISAKLELALGDLALKSRIGPDELWRSYGLAGPARRALIGAGILTVGDLAQVSPQDLAQLQGIDPKALETLKKCSGTK